MKKYLYLFGILFLLVVTGCAPAMIGVGAAGGYKVGTDERSLGQMWDDSTISTKVKAALIDDPNVKGRKIDVDTVEQIVTLTGVVDTEEESKRAAEIAQKVSYVKEVRNFLQVGKKTFGEVVDDRLLASKIKAKLIAEKDIRSLNIDVDSEMRIVTLTGVVKNESQRERVVKIAEDTLGVAKVVDNLIVK